MSEYKYEYVEVSISDVMNFYAKEFNPANEADRIADSSNWFLDQAKGKVVFKLLVETGGGKRVDPACTSTAPDSEGE